jgi:ABC-type glycerol-3-phosphate transport system substrate-binding protein
MRTRKVLIALTVAGMAIGACSNNKSNTGADSTDVSTSTTDTIATDTGAVKAADSTHSFRNDRGTDSVSAGKSIPAKP